MGIIDATNGMTVTCNFVEAWMNKELYCCLCFKQQKDCLCLDRSTGNVVQDEGKQTE